MKPFEDHFTDEAIIDELSRLRVKEAKRRNDDLFFHRITPNPVLRTETGSTDFFPPRRVWHSFRPRWRARTKKPSLRLNQSSLKRAVLVLRAREPQALWARRLRAKIEAIRERSLGRGPFAFSRPRIIPQEKDKPKAQYRPIASFGLEDRVIDCLTARYFRECFDSVLDPACLAFRCGAGENRAPQFHDAFERILRLRSRHQRAGLYVAECDIMGFFDCVHHEVAWKAMMNLVSEVERRTPDLRISPRALHIFQAFLACYSFGADVLADATARLRDETRNQHAKYKWPREELLKLHGQLDERAIGVPQGSALSCVVANCVLHSADKVLRRLSRNTKPRFTYLRYCDDMIILAPAAASCERAFDAYQQCLQELRLPTHPPTHVRRYGRKFWDGKSNAPYQWGKDVVGGKVPWIQFVGYQIRYDGLVRVRLKSLRKHFQRLVTAADELLRRLCPTRHKAGCGPTFSTRIRKNARQILHRFRQKLISMSVGRRAVHQIRDEPLPMSWASGYHALNGKRFVAAQLKALDRYRERQIRRIQARLRLMPEDRRRQKTSSIKGPRFFGLPFSYFGQFRLRESARAVRPPPVHIARNQTATGFGRTS